MLHCVLICPQVKYAEDTEKSSIESPAEEAMATAEVPTTYTTKGRFEYFKPCIQVSDTRFRVIIHNSLGCGGLLSLIHI